MTHACRGPVDADDPAPHAVGYAGLGSRGSRRAFEAIPNCVDGMSRRTICHDYGGIFTAGAPDTRVAPTVSVVGTEWAAWVGGSTGAWSGSQDSQPGKPPGAVAKHGKHRRQEDAASAGSRQQDRDSETDTELLEGRHRQGGEDREHRLGST